MTDFLAARFGTTLVLAPHADDEVLGCGGVLARLAGAGRPPAVVIVTEGHPPDYSPESVEGLKREAAAAAAVLGCPVPQFMGLPAARLDGMPHRELNVAIGAVVAAHRPDTLLLPFPGDIHRDHQLLFESAMVAARPTGPGSPAQILCYETLSETNWNAAGVAPAFTPQVSIDISDTLAAKIRAFRAYASQRRDFPQERSVEAIEALARLRGATAHLVAAEAFMLVRGRW